MILRAASQYFIRREKRRGTMKTVLYTVKKGDTLPSIAAKFHASQSVIAERNNLKGQPFEGMKLIIDEQEAFGYTVRPFDSIRSIAAKFGISEESIESLNGVSAVFVGQRILVPEKTKHGDGRQTGCN